MNTKSHFTTSKALASIWFALAIIVYSLALVAAFFAPFHLVLGIAGLATIVLLVGFQRTEKRRISDKKFNQLVLSIGLGIVMLGCLAATSN